MRLLQSIQAVDSRTLLLLSESDSWLAAQSREISKSADGPMYVFASVLLALVADQGPGFLTHFAVAIVVERGVYWVTKNGLKRRRPAKALPGFASVITAADEFSFPSGHTSAAFLFVTLLVLHFGPVFAAAYAWAAAVGLSRVYLGVHFPTDTVVGAVLGSSLALGTGVYLV